MNINYDDFIKHDFHLAYHRRAYRVFTTQKLLFLILTNGVFIHNYVRGFESETIANNERMFLDLGLDLEIE